MEEVWRPINADFPDATFTISGKCKDEPMLKLFADNNVHHQQFVEDPKDLYATQAVLLAPIFKGYGLINKVVQSMAAGTIVIGDPTAFNAIPDFIPGKHGLVADSPKQFVELLKDVFEKPKQFDKIRLEARELMLKHFQWDTRYQQLKSRLSSLSSDD